jgi:autotransporter-associated beta strand protein
VATGITDGNGVVSVVKDGSGDWYLSGTNTFSGDLRVKAGTLTVQGPKYTWFRFTLKEMGKATRYVQFRQLALYDANGVRQNVGLNVNPPVSTPYSSTSNVSYSPDSDWMALESGSFAFGSNDFLCKYTENTYVDQIFSDDNNNEGGLRTQIFTTSNAARSFSKENPETWVPFVMRLTNGAPEVVRYDIQSLSNSSNTNTWPKVASMEASVDGIHWELVETNATGEVLADHTYDFFIPLGGSSGNNGNRWYSDGTELSSGTPRPGAGFPIRGRADMPTPLQNVRSVSVAAGATLKTYDGVEISSLKVDSAGAGTIDGFTFAENGTIDVANPPDDSSFLPGTYVNCSGLENVSGWALKVNGTANAKCKVIVRNGKLYFARLGFVITFR